MRVAVNVEQLFYRAPGGTGRYAARLVTELARSGRDTVVPFMAWHPRREVDEVLRRNGLDGDARRSGAIARGVRLPLPRPLLVDAWHVARLAAPQRLSRRVAAADLVHAPSPAVPPVHGKPLVVSVHDAGFALFPGSYPPRGRRFHTQGVRRAAAADVVIAPSNAAADEIAANTPIDRSKLVVIPLGVDQVEAEPDAVAGTVVQRQLEGVPFVLWVGSLEPRKNVGTLVQAMAGLPTGAGAPHLVLVGPRGWVDSGLVASEDRAALGERLHVLGAVADDELRSLYAAATLFCFPSRHEGFGMPVLEAMVQRTAVVCADIPVLREVAGDAARFVEPTSAPAWREAIEALCSDDAARAELARAGKAHALEFTWAATGERTRAVYEDVLGRSRAR